ncbi:MAG TPA: glutathione binding-like protein [Casimicrobiaceae bacterium]|nr:glutathione binding-like protein [Casimicrobiaceae bacterium]
MPALELDDGTVLTEGAVIVQYLADLAPAAGLAPPNGTLARYQLQSWLNFITTELHKSFSPLFNPKTPDEYKTMMREKLVERFSYVDQQLAKRSFLTGETFSVADAYLYVMLRWAQAMSFDFGPWPALRRLLEHVGNRPAVAAALDAEKLRKVA